MKPTTVATSSPKMAETLQQYQCCCSEYGWEHAPLQGNYRGFPLTRYAESYNEELCLILTAALEEEVAQTDRVPACPAEAEETQEPPVKRTRRPLEPRLLDGPSRDLVDVALPQLPADVFNSGALASG